jgi:lycopene cyclase domain-containing protein
MTYFGFLIQFLVLPIILLAGLTIYDWRRGVALPPGFRGWSAWLVVFGHVLVALLYTTPWDNYLVASGVWWYDPNLVTGVVLGWVPIEEYTFFVLQPILAGLWLLYLARRYSHRPGMQVKSVPPGWTLVALMGLIWLGAVLMLLLDWTPGTYLCLILAWALPPIMLQIGFGIDILWKYRRLVLGGLLPVSLYLSVVDAVAIEAGTWTIDPAQSLQLYLGGILPFEEFLFFLVTNILIVFGITLVLTTESHERMRSFLKKLGRSGRAAWVAETNPE